MKKRSWLYLPIGFLLLLVGCRPTQQDELSLEIWHYYSGAQEAAFDYFVDEYNETVGLENGIIIEAYSQGDIDRLEEKIMNSVEKNSGQVSCPIWLRLIQRPLIL